MKFNFNPLSMRQVIEAKTRQPSEFLFDW